MNKVVLLGMNNPLRVDPEFALYPAPVNCTGWRLWKMLNARTGALKHEYLGAFERRNLVPLLTWSPRAARAHAELLKDQLRGREVIVLGAETRRALGLPELLVLPQTIGETTWRQLPHPSGRCHWYNDPGNRAVAELLLEEMYERGR